MKRYEPGEVIPNRLIINRFRDTELDIVLLEVVGYPESYFRVDEENRLIYSEKKETFPKHKLLLIDSNQINVDSGEIREDKNTLPEYLRPYLKGVFMLKDSEGIHFYDREYVHVVSVPASESTADASPAINISEISSPLEQADEITDILEGDPIPAQLRDRCSEDNNMVTLRLENTLYIADKNYHIKEKIPLDAGLDEDLGATAASSTKAAPVPPPPKPEIEKAEKENKTIVPPAMTPTATHIVKTCVDRFIWLLKRHRIHAEYFINEILREERKPKLERVYNGFLGELNEETREGMTSGDIKHFPKGFALLKSALLHELYINSTLAQRSAGEDAYADSGRNMKGLITHTILLRRDGYFLKLKEKLTPNQQQRIIQHLGIVVKKYKGKSTIFSRVHKKIQFDLNREQNEKGAQAVSMAVFKAGIIHKIYENTNRMERGDGLMIIQLNRDIMEMSMEDIGEGN